MEEERGDGAEQGRSRRTDPIALGTELTDGVDRWSRPTAKADGNFFPSPAGVFHGWQWLEWPHGADVVVAACVQNLVSKLTCLLSLRYVPLIWHMTCRCMLACTAQANAPAVPALNFL